MDYYLSGRSATGERLVIAPISAEIAAAHNMNDSESLGYFLYRVLENGGALCTAILAKLSSEDAAFEMGRILGLT